MDPFLNELWQNETEGETGYVAEEELTSPEAEEKRHEHSPSIKVFELLKQETSHDEMLGRLFTGLRTSILHYYRAIIELERARAMGEDKKSVEGSDRTRSLTHNTVIDNLNILSRYMRKLDIDNSWRSVIGLERIQVTNWVKEVAPYIILTER